MILIFFKFVGPISDSRKSIELSFEWHILTFGECLTGSSGIQQFFSKFKVKVKVKVKSLERDVAFTWMKTRPA